MCCAAPTLASSRHRFAGNIDRSRPWRGAAVVLGAICFASPAAAAELDDVLQELTQDIQTAQRDLGAAQTTISRERAELAGRINAAQNRVLDLREQAVAARRAADEETLSLSRIESRLEVWQEQSTFQSRLLAAFLDRRGMRSVADAAGIDMGDDLRLLADYLLAQQDELYPSWRDDTLVLPDGQIEQARLLRLGPVEWFWRPAAGQSGLAESNGDVLHARVSFDGAANAGIRDLQQSGTGVITFDPTLSRALLLAAEGDTLLQHLQKGGIWVIPILLFALFATVTAVLKAVELWRLPRLAPALAEHVEARLREPGSSGQSARALAQGPQAELVAIALAPQTPEQRDERLYAELLAQRNRLERWLGVIATTASVSPLLGLLGTVSGMIATFNLMTLFGAGDANAVSGGISEALVTTELGLVVAIPALIAHALMSRMVKNYFSQLERDAVHLSQLAVGAR